jgi:hypothetical protein
MKMRRAIRPVVFVCALMIVAVSVNASETNAAASGRSDVQFSEPAPYGSDAELGRRLGIQGVPLSKHDLTKEKFRTIVPEDYSTNSDWGLLVWISPSDSAWIPSDWEPEMAKHHLLFVGAYNSGNNRSTIDRMRLALDATCNMCRRFKIDRKRIYLGGFSGGARTASMVGVAYADVFTGTLCVCGVDFYQNVPAAVGQYYPTVYLPDPRIVSLAKKNGRFVLLTGENDMNRTNTKDIFEKGFRREGFSHVLYLEVPGMKHAIPGATDLNMALEFLDGTADKSGTPPRDP